VHHAKLDIPNAWLCCECGACEYACPMGLSPRHINHYLKDILRKNNIKNTLNNRPERVNRQREWMKLPVSRILKRLRIEKYAHVDFSNIPTDFRPEKVSIDIKRHIGAPAVTIVDVGDTISSGQKIADLPKDSKLSSCYHSPVNGKVDSVADGIITIKTGI